MTSPPSDARRPRLLVLASTYPRWENDPEPGFVHELSKRLASKFDVTVLAPHSIGAPTFEVMNGVEVHRYRYAPGSLESLVNNGGVVSNLKRAKWKALLVPTFVLGQMWAIYRLLRAAPVDVVHAHWVFPQGLLAAIARHFTGNNPPFVVTSHGADLFALNGRLLDALKRYVIRKAAAMTVVSTAMRDELERIGAHPQKLEVMPMGVDLATRFTSNDASRNRDEILFVGRLVEKKGMHVLLRAMPWIQSRRPGVRLLVVGFGPEEQRLRELARRLAIENAVEFLGPVPQVELPSLYRRAAVFVAPFVQAENGDREGLGLVTVEAIGCGCPVIVGDVPAVREVLAHPEDEESRVPPGDAAALAHAVLRVLENSDEALALAHRRRERVAEVFGWDRVAAGYAQLLLESLHVKKAVREVVR